MTDTASYTQRTWADALLADIGAPVTPNTEQTLVDWESAEGGAGPEWGIHGNITDFNPINVSETTGPKGYGYDPGTGKYYPGATPTPGNSPPIAAFSDWATGLQATADRIKEPFASGILSDLRANAPEASTAAAVGKSGWGTGDFASVHAAGNTPGTGPGGVAGATTAAATTPTATDTALNLNPFDLFGIPQTAASAVWSEVGPFLAKSFLVVGGITIVVLGLYRATDAGPKIRQAASSAAELGAAA